MSDPQENFYHTFLRITGPSAQKRRGIIQVNLGNILKRDRSISENSQVKAATNLPRGERGYRIMSEMRSLVPGQTIQGEVVARSGNAVQISIAGDLLLSARLDQNVNILPGQSMSFEIMSNNGSVLSLSPLYANMANGETIAKALTEAGLMQTKENLEMVSMMMEEGMPIDRDSVLHMSRQLLDFPDREALTLIRMTRLNIPITEANIEQFEQYEAMNHQVVRSAETIMDEIPQLYEELVSEGKTDDAVDFLRSVMDILGENMVDSGVEETPVGENPPAAELTNPETVSVKNQENPKGEVTLPVEDAPVAAQTSEMEELPKEDLKDREGMAMLLRELGMDEDSAAAVQRGELPAKDVIEFARKAMEELAGGKVIKDRNQEEGSPLQRLLGDKGFQTMLKEELMKQWLLKPEQVAQGKEIEKLYERMREQTARMTEALEHVGKADSALGRSVQNLQNNVDFMNQLNHVFTYVQLPLKMTGNNAHGDLYIYTNKKSLAAKDGNVSAVLHLDMEHLGMVDVYVTMKNNKVGTNFTLEDDAALDLVAEHIDILEKRLADRGYELNAKMSRKEPGAEGESGSVMQTMLEQSKNISVLSHTSFDMRA